MAFPRPGATKFLVKDEKMFMHYTISEDRSGTQESVTRGLLAALGERERQRDKRFSGDTEDDEEVRLNEVVDELGNLKGNRSYRVFTYRIEGRGDEIFVELEDVRSTVGGGQIQDFFTVVTAPGYYSLGPRPATDLTEKPQFVRARQVVLIFGNKVWKWRRHGVKIAR